MTHDNDNASTIEPPVAAPDLPLLHFDENTVTDLRSLNQMWALILGALGKLPDAKQHPDVSNRLCALFLKMRSIEARMTAIRSSTFLDVLAKLDVVSCLTQMRTPWTAHEQALLLSAMDDLAVAHAAHGALNPPPAETIH